MLSTSAEFREKIAESSKVDLKATLTFADGTALELTGGDFALGGIGTDGATSSGGSFDVGAAIVGTCDATLANYDGRFDDSDFTGATLVPYAGVELDAGGTEWLRLGTYNCEQPRSYGSTIGLMCRDNLSLMAKPYAEVATAYPATLATIVREACQACGLLTVSDDFPNASYVVERRPQDASTTCLGMVAYAAQVAGCFVACDQYGRIGLRWYDTSAFESDEGDEPGWADFHAIRSLTVATDDVVITGVTVRASNERLADGTLGEEGETETFGTAGYVLSILDNPLIEYGRAAQVAAQVGAAVVGMRFRPFDGGGLASPAWQAGDPVVVTDAMQRTHRAWLTSYAWKAGGIATLACDAATPARNSARAAESQTREIVEARNAIRAERTARALAIGALAEQLATSSGLYMTQVPQEDESIIYYMHDKPTLAESQIVWKLTADALGISTDGGETYPYGIDVTGAAILSRVYAIGIDATYVNTGRVALEDSGYIDFGLGTMHIGATSGLGSGTVQDAIDAIDGMTGMIGDVRDDMAAMESDLTAGIEDARRYATDYIEYDQSTGELVLGALDSAVKNVITNSMQAYRTDAGNVAWFGLNDKDIWEMFIQTASVRDRLSFGRFSWIARSNENMTLKWVG